MNCVQCFEKLENLVSIKNVELFVCKEPGCPNYGLVQIGICQKAN